MTVAALFHRPPTGPDADRDLLRRFADRRDDGAFAALVHRYGRLVFATCLRVLSHRADAEDAYQATFLVLARRCGAIRSDDKLAGWLHTVAVRTATEVRRMRDRAKMAPSLTLPAPTETTDPLETSELATVLDEELAKLPDHYRLAVVLCELNGVGRKAAAKELGIAEGTLSSRLAKARKLLADRLTGRGFGAVSAGALTAALASSAVARIPAMALAFGVDLCILSLTVQSVADTVVKAMFATKLKAGALVAVLLALAGGVVWTTAAGAGPGGQPAPAKDKPDTTADLVAQLGGKDFADREAAQKKLRELGAAALPAVTAGLKSDNPEVVARCERLAGAIHRDIREAFAAAFLTDKDQSKTFTHPIWRRYVGLTGDSKASRAVFAELLKYKQPDGLEVLDAADRDPAKADELYREHLVGLAKQVEPLMKYTFSIADMMPGHTSDIAAYTLFLGSIRTSATDPAKLRGEESYRYINGRNYVLAFGDGLKEGLKGNVMVTSGPQVPKGKLRAAVPGPEGTDKVFARLSSAFVASDWLPSWRWDIPEPFSTGLIGEKVLRVPDHLYAEALPTARRVVADPKLPFLRRAIWIPILRRFGDATDAVRLSGLFHEKTRLPDRGANFPDQVPVQVREWAVGTALVLRGKNPADFGFDRFPKKPPGREKDEEAWPPSAFGIALRPAFVSWDEDSVAKEKVLKAAIEWLDGEAKKEQPKKDDPTLALVQQLGSKEFAEREAAEKALKETGAAAFAAVSNGLKSDNPEIVRRCQKLFPGVRAAWLARPESAVWKRFVAITGDTPHAKAQFLEMAADPERADALTADKPAERYTALIERSVAALKKGYEEAERAAAGQTGLLLPSSGLPSKGQSFLLFFLGTHPDTAAVAPAIPEADRWLYFNLLGQALSATRDGNPFPPESRKLYAAWLATRRDRQTVRVGMSLARSHGFAEVLPVARELLTNDRMTLAERTPALFVAALSGTKADLDLVRPFLDSDAEYHRTKYTDTDRKQYPVVTQVRDVAHAAAAHLLGADPMELGFEFCEKYKASRSAAFKDDYKLGFTTADKRAAAHANVRKLLANAPVPKDFGPPKPKKLSKAAPPPAELRAVLAGPSVLCTEKLVGELEARAAVLAKKFPAAEDRARIALHTGRAIANGRLREDHARVTVLAERALEQSRDPDTRWRARSLQASAIHISGKPFAEGRRLQAEVLLTGYVELLAQDLPDADPEWPAMKKLRLMDAGPDGDPAERAAILEQRDAQEKARAEVEFVKEQVFGRKVLLMQLRDAYKPAPNDPHRNADGVDELRALAAKKMTEREVSTLMKRVLDEK